MRCGGSPLEGGFRVFIASYLNGFCSLHVQPAFLPPRLEISTLKLERFFKNSQTCHVIFLPKALSWFLLPPHEAHIPQLSIQGSVRSAAADSTVLPPDGFLYLWGSGGGEGLVILSQPRGLALSCTSVKPCVNVILSRKPFLTPFPK